MSKTGAKQYVKNNFRQQRLHRNILLIFIFVLLNSYCKAKKVPGYIVTKDSDTLYGEIRINLYNYTTRGLVLFGIDTEYLHYQVAFKNSNSKKFIIYTPEMISGFGFVFNSTDFIFHGYSIETNSIFKKNKVEYRFLNLIFKNNISLYTDNFYIQFPNEPNHVYLDYNLYLFNEKTGLKKVEKSSKSKSVQELLSQFELEEEFIEKLPDNTKFKDLRCVLVRYCQWLAKQESKKIEI